MLYLLEWFSQITSCFLIVRLVLPFLRFSLNFFYYFLSYTLFSIFYLFSFSSKFTNFLYNTFVAGYYLTSFYYYDAIADKY